jgi:uncharacterized protein
MPAAPRSPGQDSDASFQGTFLSRALSPAAVRVIPFAVFIALLAIQPSLGPHVQAWGLDPRWLYPARIFIVGGLLLLWWRHYVELHSFDGVTGARLLACITAGIVAFVLWINLDFEWARLGNGGGFDPTLDGGSALAWQFVFFRLLGLVILVPVMEELFWRSFLLRWLERHDFLRQDPARVGVRAVLICAVMFALEHHLWLAGFVAGVIYVLAYVLGRSLWLAVISHATTNAALGGWILATRSWHLW